MKIDDQKKNRQWRDRSRHEIYEIDQMHTFCDYESA